MRPAILTILPLLVASFGCSDKTAVPYKVYVTDRDAGTVTVMLPKTNFPTKSIRVGDEPTHVAASPDGRSVLVSNTGDGTLTLIDVMADIAVGTVGGIGRPQGIAFLADGRRAVVADETAGQVAVVDLDRREAVKRVEVGRQPAGVAVDGKLERILVACTGSDSVAVIDINSMKKVGSLAFGPAPRGVVCRNGVVGVTSKGSPVVRFLTADGRLNEVQVTPGDNCIAVDSTGTYAYVTGTGSDLVTVVDLEEMRIVEQVPVGPAPFGIAVSPDQLFYFVALTGTDIVRVVDRAPNNPTDKVQLTSQPYCVTVAEPPGREQPQPGFRELSLEEFAELLEDTLTIPVNVQVPHEGDIDRPGLYVPYDQVLDSLQQFPADRTRALALYCRDGRLSAKAADRLAKAGFRNVCTLKPGYRRWIVYGMPFQLRNR